MEDREEAEHRRKMESAKYIDKIITYAAIFILVLVIAGMYGCPQYRVYSRTQEGKAEYQQAVENRRIKVEEAKAKNEAAISEAEAMIKIAHAENESRVIKAEGENKAMIIRAQGIRQADSIKAIGVAEANKIIGNSLRANEAYLKYLWVTSIDNNDKIYIPTEANIPILEVK